MKTIIVSDVKGDSKSVIPYGLNLAKHLHSEVDIVHVVDTKTQEEVYGSYSDSQTLTSGNKLSYDEIIRREKQQIHRVLDTLLSKETSKLNYPLKINTIIEENNVENELRKELLTDPSTLLVVNTESNNHIFSSQAEIIDTIENIDALTLLIPPGQTFRGFHKILFLTDFNEAKLKKYDKLFSLLEQFKPKIDAIDIVKSHRKFVQKVDAGKRWKEIISNAYPELTIETNILAGNNYMNTLIKHLQHDRPDVILMFRKKKNFTYHLFLKRPAEKLMNLTYLPILYCA